jgi:hypothetical protein
MSNCGGCDEITLPIGEDGQDGKNAFTITTSSFIQPAVGLTETINVSNLGQFTNAWAAAGQIIYITDASGNGGWYSVVSTAGSTSITITNLYATNTPAGLTINSGASVSPSGPPGINGTNGTNGSNGNTGSQGPNGIDGTTLLKSATGVTTSATTFTNIATPLTFLVNQLCAINGDKAVLEATISNTSLLKPGIAGEVKVILDTDPSTSPQNISRVPVTLLEVSSVAQSSGTLRVEIYRKTQVQALVTVTYIDSRRNSISYISGATFATDFGAALSLTIQGRLISAAGVNAESISCPTLTVSSFKQ